MGLRCIAAISSLAALIVSAVPEVQNLTPPDESFQEESLPTPEASDMVEILDLLSDPLNEPPILNSFLLK